MKRTTSVYELSNGVETVTFNSEKEACEYLGVKQCTVARCFKDNCKCKGYTIRKMGLSTHGETKTRLFKVWESMRARCEYKKHPHFKDYGARGISVCEEWQDFNNFKSWAALNGYTDKLTIDRIDNDGNYEPTNCRWVTAKQQQNNKRNNHIIGAFDEVHTLSEWSEITGINSSTIKERLKRGWNPEKALSQPTRKYADMRGEEE